MSRAIRGSLASMSGVSSGFAALKAPRWTLRVFFVLVIIGLLFLGSCGEDPTAADKADSGSDIEPDSTLPEGYVSKNRPPNPGTTFKMPCPLGEINDPFNNPFLIIDGFPEGIHAVDAPDFISIYRAAPSINSLERIIAVDYEGEVRGFPVKILLYHELVNLCWEDSTGQHYSFVTYCPLVDGAIHFVYDFPCYQVKEKSFGVSGLLYNGNLVMYIRNSGDPRNGIHPDYFSQLSAGGIDGTCAEIEPAVYDMTWGMFRRLFPSALVLSENTGHVPPGGYNYLDHPYVEYWRNNDLFFPVAHEDSRLKQKVPVYGVLTPTGEKAYYTPEKMYVKNDDIGGTRVVVWNYPSFSATAAYEPVVDGQYLTFSFKGNEKNVLPLYEDAETNSLWTFDGIAVKGPLKGRRLPHLTAFRVFWFAWAAFYPQTELYVP